MNKKYYFDKNQINKMIELYNNGLSFNKIGKLYNCSKRIINKNIRNFVKIKDNSHCNRTYNIDENIFEIIDSHEKAYWYGMLAGDANIGCKNRNNIHLSLEKEDDYLIYEFRNFLKSNHPIKYISNGFRKDGTESVSCYFYITNKKICNDLNNLGLHGDKTKNLKFPNKNQLRDDFLSSYILGLIDSDGSIHVKTDNHYKDNRRLCLSFIGTIDMATNFQKILVKKCNVPENKLDPHGATEYITSVTYAGYKDVFKIMKFIYTNSPIWMDRKKINGINYLLTRYPNDEWLLNNINNFLDLSKITYTLPAIVDFKTKY